jgi:polyisoprenyl-phosphate glycosyltransferase
MRYFPIFLSVVFVIRNQSSQLKNILSDATKLINPIVSDYELIIVDNASDDGSTVSTQKSHL